MSKIIGEQEYTNAAASGTALSVKNLYNNPYAARDLYDDVAGVPSMMQKQEQVDPINGRLHFVNGNLIVSGSTLFSGVIDLYTFYEKYTKSIGAWRGYHSTTPNDCVLDLFNLMYGMNFSIYDGTSGIYDFDNVTHFATGDLSGSGNNWFKDAGLTHTYNTVTVSATGCTINISV